MPQTRSASTQKNVNYSESDYDKRFNAMLSNNNRNTEFAKPAVRTSKRKRKARDNDSDDYKPISQQPAHKRRKVYHHVDTPLPSRSFPHNPHRRSTRIALKLSMHEHDNHDNATDNATLADKQQQAAGLESEEKDISQTVSAQHSAAILNRRRSARSSSKQQRQQQQHEDGNVDATTTVAERLLSDENSDSSVVDFPPQPTVRRSARLQRSTLPVDASGLQDTENTAPAAAAAATTVDGGWDGRLRAQQQNKTVGMADDDDDDDVQEKTKKTRKDSDYDDEQFQNDIAQENADLEDEEEGGGEDVGVCVEEEGEDELNGHSLPRRRSKRLQKKHVPEHEHEEHDEEAPTKNGVHDDEDDDSLPISLRRSRRNRRPPPRLYEEVQALELYQRRQTLRARKPINYTESPDETQHGGVGGDGNYDDGDDDDDDGDEEYTVNNGNTNRGRARRFSKRNNNSNSTTGRTRSRSNTRRRRRNRRRMSSDDDSSSESCSTDTFMELREQKRIARQRRKINPIQIHDLGLYHEGMAPNLAAGKKKNKASAADVSPMEIDTKIGWNVVGGLQHHVQKLKEMVVLPLLYPSEFASFQMSTPKGVLFHGPPGTGKTLVARVLAAQCSMGCNADGTPRTKVSFYMRKGADCLSKWVGEAERQLRLLFDEAQKNQPAVIFFDEIDGLAPVRSSRQDQIHSSIVSTLLALMDGLDSRGQIIVIGATNRPDAIDPALRRPGRFDRELCFNLPTKQARRDILKIHTRSWQNSNCKLGEDMLTYLSEQCVGFCGADLEALCREAFLAAVRRTYPQIYHSNVRLQLDTRQLTVIKDDFEKALKDITPSSQRSSLVYARALPKLLRPLLEPQLEIIRRDISAIFALKEEEAEDVVATTTTTTTSNSHQHKRRLCSQHYRYLIHGADARYGQSYLGTAVLHLLEEYPLYSMDLASIMGDSTTKCAEECILRMFKEAQRNTPSVLYWPHIDRWWSAAHDVLRTSVTLLIDDIAQSCPILLVATADRCMQDLDETLQAIFAKYAFHDCTQSLSEHQRRQFWSQIATPMREQPQHRPKSMEEFEQLPVAEIPKTAPDGGSGSGNGNGDGGQVVLRTDSERLIESERMACVNLRTYIRAVCNRLCKHFKNFIDRTTEDGVVHNTLSLFDIRQRNNARAVPTVIEFLRDIDELVDNVKQSAQTESLKARQFINEACHLQDQALSMMSQVNRDLVKQCDKLAKQQRRQSPLPPPPPPQQQQQERHVSFADEEAVAPTTQNGHHNRNSNNNRNHNNHGDKQEMEEDVDMMEAAPADVHDSATEVEHVELPPKTIEIDEHRVNAMIEKLVSLTPNVTVQELEEKMYNLLRIIYQYSNRLVRTGMMDELEQHIYTYFKLRD